MANLEFFHQTTQCQVPSMNPSTVEMRFQYEIKLISMSFMVCVIQSPSETLRDSQTAPGADPPSRWGTGAPCRSTSLENVYSWQRRGCVRTLRPPAAVLWEGFVWLRRQRRMWLRTLRSPWRFLYLTKKLFLPGSYIYIYMCVVYYTHWRGPQLLLPTQELPRSLSPSLH